MWAWHKGICHCLHSCALTDNSTEVKRQLCQLLEFENERLPCWGYEDDSNEDCLLYKPECPHRAESWARNKVEQMKVFFESGDFGYIRERRSELQSFCKPNDGTASSLKCTQFMRYCTGKNVFINLRRVGHIEEPIRYREDVLQHGDIGGWNCTLSRSALLREGDHKSPLMSWFAEMTNFKVVDGDQGEQCDVTLDKPTLILKLDATSNMYHHFCDFLNLYLSQHVNGSTFNRDNHILLWDTFPYRGPFASVWTAFTRNPILTLSDFKGKRVCFRDVTFPLLPRMIFGLYYNMPLIPGCTQSGLFRSFNRHLLYHLQQPPTEVLHNDATLHITFISRSTKYRRVLNEEALIKALKRALEQEHIPVNIHLVDLNHRLPFSDQVALTSRSDVLIGMHGAGLTHTLLQPDYGVLFELHNCQDPDCYRDLARLRGTHYLTWEDDTKLVTVEETDQQAADRLALGAAHAKFVNYKFDEGEFVRLALEAIAQARRRKDAFKVTYTSKWWWTRGIPIDLRRQPSPNDGQTTPGKTEL